MMLGFYLPICNNIPEQTNAKDRTISIFHLFYDLDHCEMKKSKSRVSFQKVLSARCKQSRFPISSLSSNEVSNS